MPYAIELDLLDGTRAWSGQDPYVVEGVFAVAEGKPVVQVGP